MCTHPHMPSYFDAGLLTSKHPAVLFQCATTLQSLSNSPTVRLSLPTPSRIHILTCRYIHLKSLSNFCHIRTKLLDLDEHAPLHPRIMHQQLRQATLGSCLETSPSLSLSRCQPPPRPGSTMAILGHQNGNLLLPLRVAPSQAVHWVHNQHIHHIPTYVHHHTPWSLALSFQATSHPCAESPLSHPRYSLRSTHINTHPPTHTDMVWRYTHPPLAVVSTVFPLFPGLTGNQGGCPDLRQDP